MIGDIRFLCTMLVCLVSASACSPGLIGRRFLSPPIGKVKLNLNFGTNGYSHIDLAKKSGFKSTYTNIFNSKVIKNSAEKTIFVYGSTMRNYALSTRRSKINLPFEISGFVARFKVSGEFNSNDWQYFDFNDAANGALKDFSSIYDVVVSGNSVYLFGSGVSDSSNLPSGSSDTDLFVAKLNMTTGALDTTWGDIRTGTTRTGIRKIHLGQTKNNTRSNERSVGVLQKTNGSVLFAYQSDIGQPQKEFKNGFLKFDLLNGTIDATFGTNGNIQTNYLSSRPQRNFSSLSSNGTQFKNARITYTDNVLISSTNSWELFIAEYTETGINTRFGNNGKTITTSYPQSQGNINYGAPSGSLFRMPNQNIALAVIMAFNMRVIQDRVYLSTSSGNLINNFGPASHPGYVEIPANNALGVMSFLQIAQSEQTGVFSILASASDDGYLYRFSSDGLTHLGGWQLIVPQRLWRTYAPQTMAQLPGGFVAIGASMPYTVQSPNVAVRIAAAGLKSK